MDLHFHVGSWVDMVQAWKSGVPVPGWAAHANYGLGDPRLTFYPPVSGVVGGLLTALLPASAVLPVYLWLLTSLAGLTMYKLSARFVDQDLRLPAALLYIFSYFMLVKSIHYAAFAELFCDALLPLLFFFIIRFFEGDRRGTWVIPNLLALFVLTDVPIAIGTLYLVAAVALVLAWPSRAWKPLLVFWLLELLGVAEAAFYLLPAMAGRKTIVSSGALFYRLDFLFGVHTGLARTSSLYMVAGAAFLLFRMQRERQSGVATRFLLWSALGGFLLQLKLSKPLWLYLPEFFIVGFPERLQVFMFLAVPLIFLRARPGLKARLFLYGTYAAMALMLPLATYLHIRHKQPEPIAAIFRQSQTGSEGVPEYITPATGAKFFDHNNVKSAPAAAHVLAAGSDCQAAEGLWAPQLRRVQIASPAQGAGCDVTLRLYEHPYWHLLIDGKQSPSTTNRLGLLAFHVPAGEHTAVLRYAPPSGPLSAGIALSLLALVLSTLPVLPGRWYPPAQGAKPVGKEPERAEQALLRVG